MIHHLNSLEITRNPVKNLTILVALLINATLVGCGQPERTFEREKTFQVTGKALVDGKPVELPKQLQIRCVKKGENRVTDGKIVSSGGAFTEADGSFVLSTYEKGDGIQPGDYVLLFELSQLNMMTKQRGEDELNGKYANPNDPIATVSVTGNETEPIDLGTIELTSE